MKKIISVSRRTDIPAFYGDWFINRLKEGIAGYVNPFSNSKHLVSLKKEDVLCFVFWSKNFIPFMDKLKIIKQWGYNFYFNYTINGFPEILEQNTAKLDSVINNIKELSDLYSIKSINWRYDPIIISDLTPFDYHLNNFYNIANNLNNYVERCYFSFVNLYGKVKNNFNIIHNNNRIKFYNPDQQEKNDFTGKLSEIARQFGISMYSCCNDVLVNNGIKKAHCIDIDIINDIFGIEYLKKYKIRPTRKECGCYDSIDIGTYNTCIHGCIYCYANTNKINAINRNKYFDKDSAFLCFSRSLSDKWIQETGYLTNNLQVIDR